MCFLVGEQVLKGSVLAMLFSHFLYLQMATLEGKAKSLLSQLSPGCITLPP